MIKLQAVIRRRWWVVVVAAVIGVAASVASTFLVSGPKAEQIRYKSGQVIVLNPGASANSSVLQDSLRITQAQVAGLAAEMLGSPGEGPRLASAVTVTADPESSSITIAATADDPARAMEVADAFASAFIENIASLQQEGKQARVDDLQDQFAAAQQELNDFDTAHPTGVGVVLTPAQEDQRQQLSIAAQQARQQVDAARAELSSSSPYSSLGRQRAKVADSGIVSVPTSFFGRAALLVPLAVLLGIGLVYLIERVFQRIDTREELVAVTDVPILTEIGWLPPKRRRTDLDGHLHLDGPWAEPYRRLRAAIQFVESTHAARTPGEPTPCSFLVTSSMPGEGKSTTTAVTALALAEAGVPTVVVGADFRKPGVERLIGDDGGLSLQDRAVMSADRPEIDDLVRPTSKDDLYLARSGTATREVTRCLEIAREVTVEARRRGATVMVDTSPLQAATDAIDLLPAVDHVLLVVRSGRSTPSSVRQSLESLDRAGASVLGLVLIGTPSVGRTQAYYEEYYAAPAMQQQ